MALETDHKVDFEFFAFFDVAEQLFLAVYTVEFIAKIYVDPIRYWKTGFNVFDFIVLMLSYIQRIFMHRNSHIMSWFHVVRPLRILRAISLIRGLQVLVSALVKTIKNAIFVLFLLFLLMTAFALIAYNFYGDSKTGDFKNWGSLKAAYFTLFSLVTLDGWSDLEEETHQFGFKSSRLFVMCFILLGVFLFVNLFIGVIIINIRKTSQFETFSEMIGKFKQTLRHDDFVMLDDICSSLTFIDIYLSSLDEQDDTLYKLQQLYFEISYVLGNVLRNVHQNGRDSEVNSSLMEMETHAVKN
ncbi:cation channel sperm-associated protein 3-like isoform X2 [Hypanus sabinus]|uniref:cation channel sperm-associated protein 3-like isoform X2 n=1 Tax=Hypanus sabinus TaxID=79690 RepID=UPI0028C47F28|nr:cation channel sperm-associated protein 3-like isoform X2 [Hypanus sabinus]